MQLRHLLLLLGHPPTTLPPQPLFRPRSPSLLQLNSFGGGVAGIPMRGSRTFNASELSLGTFLENNGGDINDILNDFGVPQ